MSKTSDIIALMLEEDERRVKELHPKWNPVTGENSILERKKVYIRDYDLPTQYLPLSMLEEPLLKAILNAGSIRNYIYSLNCCDTPGELHSLMDETCFLLTRLRHKHDFAFWCATIVKIEPKRGGGVIPFILNRPQRKTATEYERQRLAGIPIRNIILKARQWGGSTVTQIYIAWLQMCHKTGLNSLIIAQVKDTATVIRGMFSRLIASYPKEYFFCDDKGMPIPAIKSRFESYQGSRNISYIAPRDCKIQIGSAEYPDTCRGENHTCVHCSEVAIWKKTQGKSPEDIVQGATSGILYEPLTMIVYESTALHTGDFFHEEWKAAVSKTSQFSPIFVSWYEIEQYRLKVEDKAALALRLYEKKDRPSADTNREEPGKYLWWLWEKGATLEHIAWYIEERKKYSSHERMAREYPTDDAEAFANTAASVFSILDIARLRHSCRPPVYRGEIEALGYEGEEALKGIRFREDSYGEFFIWQKPEKDDDKTTVTDRYLVVVDVGRGISDKADFSDILVFDRMFMIDGGKPVVVAEWHGHIDIDLLAWKAAQIALWYNNALLVIESNTIESNGGVGSNMADSSYYVLELLGEMYPNLYYREQSPEDIIKKAPKKIGFHTNRKTKGMVIQALKKAVREQEYVELSTDALHEFEVYEQKPNGSYGAAIGEHDDRLMTRAIGLFVCFSQMDKPRIVPRKTINNYRPSQRPSGEATF